MNPSINAEDFANSWIKKNSENFRNTLQELTDIPIKDKDLSKFVRALMEDGNNEQIAMVLEQWGAKIAYDVFDMGIFWQRSAALENALPYFVALSQKHQRQFAYEAVTIGYDFIVKAAVPALTPKCHCDIISDAYSMGCMNVAECIYEVCDKPQTIERLYKTNAEASQWVEDKYRPEHERTVLQQTVGQLGGTGGPKKI